MKLMLIAGLVDLSEMLVQYDPSYQQIFSGGSKKWNNVNLLFNIFIFNFSYEATDDCVYHLHLL